jgi:hypothetical protein
MDAFWLHLPFGPKAWAIGGALEALRDEGVMLSHRNVQFWLACFEPGLTVSERHYHRVKRLFREHRAMQD